MEVPLAILTSLSPKPGSRQEERRADITVQSVQWCPGKAPGHLHGKRGHEPGPRSRDGISPLKERSNSWSFKHILKVGIIFLNHLKRQSSQTGAVPPKSQEAFQDLAGKNAFSTCLLCYGGAWGEALLIPGTTFLAASGKDEQGAPSLPSSRSRKLT